MKESRSIYKSPVGFQYGSTPREKMKFTKARPRSTKGLQPRRLDLETKESGREKIGGGASK